MERQRLSALSPWRRARDRARQMRLAPQLPLCDLPLNALQGPAEDQALQPRKFELEFPSLRRRLNEDAITQHLNGDRKRCSK